MTFLLSILFFAVVITVTAFVFWKEQSLKKIFWSAMVVKSLAGISVGIIYMWYYKTGDTLVFYSDAVKLAEFARTNPSDYFNFLFTSQFPQATVVDLSFDDKRAIFMDKIVSLFCLVSFDNYWVITFYLTLISFFGSWYLVKQIVHIFPQAAGPAVVAFLFVPSITFWTSGLIKETLAMAGLYFLCGLLVKLWYLNRIKVIDWLVALLAVYLLWNLKYYFAGIFLAIAAATMIYRLIYFNRRFSMPGVFPYVIWVGIFTVLMVGVTFLHPNFRSHKLLEVMVSNHDAFVEFSKPEAVISFHDVKPTFMSMLINSPKALFSGLFRPLFFDAHNILAFVLSIENLLLLALTVIAIRHVAKLFTSDVGILLFAIVVYVILLAIFITLSTPNLGTLARYRVGYLPFFVFLILLAPPVIVRLQKIINIPAKGN